MIWINRPDNVFILKGSLYFWHFPISQVTWLLQKERKKKCSGQEAWDALNLRLMFRTGHWPWNSISANEGQCWTPPGWSPVSDVGGMRHRKGPSFVSALSWEPGSAFAGPGVLLCCSVLQGKEPRSVWSLRRRGGKHCQGLSPLRFIFISLPSTMKFTGRIRSWHPQIFSLEVSF